MNGAGDREDYRRTGVKSARDALLLGLDSAEQSLREIVAGISESEYDWEPTPEAERAADRMLPAHQKRVWRVFQEGGAWHYDYAVEAMASPAFTTIAWLMNHIAQTADMYLYCIQSGKPVGVEREWDDLPVPSSLEAMWSYLFDALGKARAYLVSMREEDVEDELNRETPAPWGEMRPTYLNLWGGIVEHAIQHASQIAGRKDRIRYGW